MANQTVTLNVSDEMKLDDVRQDLCELEHVEELCSSSLDTTEELYSSSEPDTCGDCLLAKQETLILCGLAGVHIAELTGKSERAIKRQTIEMQEKGLIYRENGKRNGRWKVLLEL